MLYAGCGIFVPYLNSRMIQYVQSCCVLPVFSFTFQKISIASKIFYFPYFLLITQMSPYLYLDSIDIFIKEHLFIIVFRDILFLSSFICSVICR